MSLSIDRTPSPRCNPPAVSPSETPTAAYLHIPFCRRRCYYCDFAVSIVGDKPPLKAPGEVPQWQTIADYVDVLCQEIQATPALGRPLDTVFFGGGTPSLLTVEQLERILQTLDRQFGIGASAELSMEMDPGTFDSAKLQGYVAAGINRVSLGVQSFQAELLAACGRTHTPADIEVAIGFLHQAGVTNFSLDLISGLPHQTVDHWRDSLQQAIDLAPPHLSIYDLTIEPETAFGRWYQPGATPLPSDEMTADLYRLAQRMLAEASYDHYEISNYAKPGYQCRHNRVYWENRPYYGFGMGAASYVQGQRFTRPRKRSDYYPWVQQLIADAGQIDCPVTPLDERLLDQLMVGLRLAEGLSLAELAHQYGRDRLTLIVECLRPYIERGWVQITDMQGQVLSAASLQQGHHVADQRLRLSDPEGFLFSNVVLSTLFEKLT